MDRRAPQPIDAGRYRIRFTARKASSIWSTVNVKRVAELSSEGLMQPAAHEAFARRRAERSGVCSHEGAGEPELDTEQLALLQVSPEAWAFLGALAPSYRKAALWWVVNAKRPATRERRLAALTADSAQDRRLRHLTSPGKRP